MRAIDDDAEVKVAVLKKVHKSGDRCLKVT